MKIYLDGQLLVKSKKFENYFEEKSKRGNSSSITEHRGYNIYTWGSRGKLTRIDDKIPWEEEESIVATVGKVPQEVTKDNLKEDEFLLHGLGKPDHVISLDSYNSFMPIYQSTALNIIKQLEAREIDCLLGTKSAPIMIHKQYISKKLEELLKNPIKEIEL